MAIIATDVKPSIEVRRMLEGYDCPAILVSKDYKIIATNRLYNEQFGQAGELRAEHRHCFEVSHGYSVPCDQAGEDCPLAAAINSGHKERVLHVHQTPRGKEHVDVEMLPIFDEQGALMCFVELLRAVPIAGAEDSNQMMVGASKAFNTLIRNITRVSATDASVLLLGESGTGKELAARAVHESSKRKDKALVTLECAGLTDALFESEMFGHIKGAYTGAHTSKTGLVAMADGGTLFLDEIGDVPLSMQVKLLRLLESGTFRPVGSLQNRSSDFRLICATHKNIPEMVSQGLFRQDLYYRINVFPIKIPSLKERRDDLALIMASLVKRISPKKEYYFTDTAVQALKQYTFPGNIRELRNILNRAIVLTETNVIEADVIHECLAIDRQNPSSISQNSPSGISDIEAAYEVDGASWVDLKTAEQRYLSALMQANNQNKEKVASIAGISLRSLYRKLGEINDSTYTEDK